MVTASRTTTDALQSLVTALQATVAAAQAVAEARQSDLERDYSLAEVAEVVGMSDDWLREQCKAGRIAHQCYGGRYFMSREQIAQFREQHAAKVKARESAKKGGRR